MLIIPDFMSTTESGRNFAAINLKRRRIGTYYETIDRFFYT